MSAQTTDTIMMIRPVNFGFNQQTAVNNYYQKERKDLSDIDIQKKALEEFDNFVFKLRSNQINVELIEDTEFPFTPDSIFPNNWISFHSDGSLGLYPMYAENRRLERREDILEIISKNYSVSKIHDLTFFEKGNKFLEGTGSVVLDRINKIAYASISERTNSEVMSEFCKRFSYENVSFSAYQNVGGERLPIYHTNVLMCVATEFVVICLEVIDNLNERKLIKEKILNSGKRLIEITEDQKNTFAGNMLEVRSEEGKYFLIMSTSAYNSLYKEQINQIEQYSQIIHSSLDTIETLGGGSARCMMAEVFLPKK